MSLSSIPSVLNNLERYMVITLTQNISEYEKCNIDPPLAQPFMCCILQNVVSILFYFKVLFLKSGVYSLLPGFYLVSFATWLPCHWIRGSIIAEISGRPGHSTVFWQQNWELFLFCCCLYFHVCLFPEMKVLLLGS